MDTADQKWDASREAGKVVVKHLLIAAFIPAAVILFVGCGESSTEPVPELARAAVTIDDSGSWVACSVNCYFQGTAQNTGSGCASEVRGLVRFYGSNNAEIGSGAWRPYPVSVALSTLRPGETFSYRTTHVVDAGVVAATMGFQATVSWTDVRC